MSDHELAAKAIRSVAHWKQRATVAEEKVASLEREKQIETITKVAEAKGANIPKDLTKLAAPELRDLERVLGLITPKGDIKLATVDEDGPELSRKLSDLEEFLLTQRG